MTAPAAEAPAAPASTAASMLGAPPAAPPAAPAGTPAAAPTGSWTDAITDTEARGFIELKGWKSPDELVKSYRNLEKLQGTAKVPLPTGPEDAEGYARVYDALGRPKTAEEYGLKAPEGVPPEFTQAAAAKFHEAGLNTQQAQAVTAWYNEQVAAQTAAAQQAMQVQTENDLKALRSEWGSAYDENTEAGRRAARQFGLDAEALGKMEQAMGTGPLLKFMAQVGRGLGEGKFVSGDEGGQFGLTPAAATARIAELKGDPAWLGRWAAGGVKERNELARLTEIQVSGQEV